MKSDIAQEIVWDRAEALTLTPVSATAASALVSAASVATLTTSDHVLVGVDGAAATDLALSTSGVGTITATTLATDIDALAGIAATATDTATTVTAVSGTTGAASAVVVQRKARPARAVVSHANNLGTSLSLWVDGARDATAVDVSGKTATQVASALDALAGITATVTTAAVSSTVAFDATNTQAAGALTFGLTVGNAVVTALDVSAATDGATLATLVQTALRAADNAATTLSAAWSTNVLTITDTAGRHVSGGSLVDAGGQVDATITYTQGTEAAITVVSDTFGSSSSVHVLAPVSTGGWSGANEVTATGTDATTLGTATGTAATLGAEGEWSGLYVGVAGDVKVDMKTSGTAVVFKAAPVGVLKLNVSRVYNTGTTATNLVGLK